MLKTPVILPSEPRPVALKLMPESKEPQPVKTQQLHSPQPATLKVDPVRDQNPPSGLKKTRPIETGPIPCVSEINIETNVISRASITPPPKTKPLSKPKPEGMNAQSELGQMSDELDIISRPKRVTRSL